MAKVRVYEYAKAIDVSSKDIIAALKDMNVEVNNHMATLEDDTVKKLDAIYKKAKQKKETANEKPAEQKKKQSSNKNNDRKRRMTCRIINLKKKKKQQPKKKKQKQTRWK
ncbi:hypothetical protein BsIDN1_30710 [Bacillus safensis]|uniref:Translation initiation factor IF-2 N-terminal domain-containing protein n=1 Tax=Bacillus safensis TaxID=561879 RepID=A0A5S9M8K0_BACIA|nr:hypothetical protein BsIDN1_30710 [Bacillus safensis]